MWILSRFWEKVCKVAEGGSRYCSKKSDDNCGDEVKVIPFSPLFSLSLFFMDFHFATSSLVSFCFVIGSLIRGRFQTY